MATTSKLTFPQGDFHGDLRKRIDAYFAENNISKYANTAMVLKSIFWFSLAWGAWGVAVFADIPMWARLVMFAVQGFGVACIGFNIGHDSIHGSYSAKKWVNKTLAWSFDLMGASSYTWSVSHNVVHHTFTNIPGVDNDLEPGPWMVFYPQKTKPWHRFQHFFAWGLYCFVAIVWMYTKDFGQLKNKDPLTGKGATAKDIAQLLTGKALHLTLFVALPIIFIPGPLWMVLLGYLIMLAVVGFSLAIVFQLAHCVEGCVFPRVPAANKMTESWAEHQMRTTANFGKTWLATFICGGLDHQIEHHLFPRICHIHYPKLAPIVRQCAAEHGLPYIHNGSFAEAVVVHARTLKKLGRGEGAEFEHAVNENVETNAAYADAAE